MHAFITTLGKPCGLLASSLWIMCGKLDARCLIEGLVSKDTAHSEIGIMRGVQQKCRNRIHKNLIEGVFARRRGYAMFRGFVAAGGIHRQSYAAKRYSCLNSRDVENTWFSMMQSMENLRGNARGEGRGREASCMQCGCASAAAAGRMSTMIGI